MFFDLFPHLWRKKKKMKKKKRIIIFIAKNQIKKKRTERKFHRWSEITCRRGGARGRSQGQENREKKKSLYRDGEFSQG
jgi:hypothetical protein